MSNDRLLVLVTRRDIDQYVAALLRRGLKPRTVDKRLSLLRPVIAHAVQDRALVDALFQGVQVPRVHRRSRKPFPLPLVAQIYKRLLERLPDLVARGTAGYALLFLLAPFTGARMEELGQLRVQDVKQAGEVVYIEVVAGAKGIDGGHERRLKTAQSERCIPVHRALLEAGFMDYVERLRRRGEYWLFPCLQADGRGKRTGRFSKWASRFLRQTCGIDDRDLVFHSFRHLFEDLLRGVTDDTELRDRLMGHASRRGYQYGNGFSLERLDAVVQRIDLGPLPVAEILEGVMASLDGE